MDIIAFAPIAGHHIVTWLLIGLVAGVLAHMVVRGSGSGLVSDVLVGLAGAVIGGFILHEVRGGPNVSPSVGWEILIAFGGAVILLLLSRASRRSRARF